MPSFLSCARIKLGLVRPDKYNDLILSVASFGKHSLVNEKKCLFAFILLGKKFFNGEID